MNLVCTPTLTPLRVMVINPLIPASQLIIVKMLSGIVFGHDQLLDITLLVYTNELPSAKQYAQDLISCAFPCFNSIRPTSDLPKITDADVFFLVSGFENPNELDFDKLHGSMSDKIFDTIFLILKIAQSFAKPLPPKENEKLMRDEKNHRTINKHNIVPFIVTDGLISMDILNTFSNLPSKYFFCSTPLRSLALTILSDYLQVQCYQINNVLVWGANDSVFHVEIQKPYLRHDKISEASNCDWDAVGKELFESFKRDHVQFNASWMKREFIEKIYTSAKKNPYGVIYRAAEMAKTIRAIWEVSSTSEENEVFTSLGVISNGALGTIKVVPTGNVYFYDWEKNYDCSRFSLFCIDISGVPYILPICFAEGRYTVNTAYSGDNHVKTEIKRINEAAKERHSKLVPFCQKFLENQVINQDFMHQTHKAIIPGGSRHNSLLIFEQNSSTSSSQTLEKKEGNSESYLDYV